MSERVSKFREKIRTHTEQGLNKSYLKSNVDKYENCCPAFDIDKLEKLLNIDIEACQNITLDCKNGNKNLDTIVENYNQFMKAQQEALKEFVIKQ